MKIDARYLAVCVLLVLALGAVACSSGSKATAPPPEPTPVPTPAVDDTVVEEEVSEPVTETLSTEDVTSELPDDLMVSVSGVRGRVGAPLTPELFAAVAASFGAFLAREGHEGSVMVARDSRTSGPMFYRAVVAGQAVLTGNQPNSRPR